MNCQAMVLKKHDGGSNEQWHLREHNGVTHER